MSTHSHLPSPHSLAIENIQPHRASHLPARACAGLLTLIGLLVPLAQAHSAVAGPASATSYRDGRWLQRSPVGGDIVDVAFSPQDRALMLAAHVDSTSATNGALYRSIDAGNSWSPVPGLDAMPVYDVEFASDGRIYAGTLDGIAMSSTDGRVWQHASLGIGLNDAVLDIAIDPRRPSTLWAGIADAQGLQPVRVMRSDDAGRSWSNRTPPLTRSMSCREIAIDPLDSRRVAAVFGGDFSAGEVWVSEDGGSHWANRSSGLPPGPLRSVAFAGTRLLVAGGLRLGQQDVGLYASADLGQSWTALHDARWPSRFVESIAVSPLDNKIILIATDGDGLHRSEDGGLSWQIGVDGTLAQSLRSVRFRPGSGDAGSDEDVAIGSIGVAIGMSHDRGRHFVSASQGIHGLNVAAVAIDPLNDRHLAVATAHLNGGAVYTSHDQGENWTRESAPATRYTSLAFAEDGTLYAISGGPSSVAPEALYRRNADASWTSLGPDQGPQYETDIHALRIGSGSNALIVLAGNDRGSMGTEGTVWLSRDRGMHWHKSFESSGSGSVRDIEMLQGESGLRLLAGYDDGSGAGQGRVLLSDDQGGSWQDASRGLPAMMSRPRLCVAGPDPRIVYVGVRLANARSRLYRSEDSGSSWSPVGSEGDAIVDVACDPVDPETLYVSRQGSPAASARIERSQDGGARFDALTQGAEALRNPGQIAANLAADQGAVLLVASSRGSYLARVGAAAN